MQLCKRGDGHFDFACGVDLMLGMKFSNTNIEDVIIPRTGLFEAEARRGQWAATATWPHRQIAGLAQNNRQYNHIDAPKNESTTGYC